MLSGRPYKMPGWEAAYGGTAGAPCLPSGVGRGNPPQTEFAQGGLWKGVKSGGRRRVVKKDTAIFILRTRVTVPFSNVMRVTNVKQV